MGKMNLAQENALQISVPNNTRDQQLARIAICPAFKGFLFLVFVLVAFWSLGTQDLFRSLFGHLNDFFWPLFNYF